MGIERKLQIHARSGVGPDALPVEMCEHKGVGHPDTLTDGACEAAAIALAAAYISACGRVLHFNVDKGLLIAGKSVPRFGGGEIVEPIKLIVCGRATQCEGKFVAIEVVEAAVEDYLRRTVRADPALFKVIPEIKPGSENLARIFASGRAIANDTSFGVGFAPSSRLERLVLETAELLRSEGFRRQYPAAGDDFKVMGLRLHEEMRFTVALALIDRHIANLAQYFETKASICARLARALPGGSTIRLNCLDDAAATGEGGVYLTVTGLSAEMGDDGQAGRGNRLNGLITPNRPMSLEAAAGKNPVSHVGKIYNVLSNAIAHDIVDRIEGVETVEVHLLSRIGQPVDQPEMVRIEVGPSIVLTDGARREIGDLVDAWLDRLDVVTSDLAHGLIRVY